MTNMKEELIELLSAEFGSFEHQSDLIDFASDLIDFYEENRDQSTAKFKQLLEKYNFETINKFSQDSECPHVTLFHGIFEFEFQPTIYEGGGVSDFDEEIGTIIEQPPIWLDEENYDASIQSEIVDLRWRIHQRVVFVWLSTIWQNIHGYDYGIVTKTLENNSSRQFIFNDLSWDDFSDFTEYNNKEERLGRCFEKDLTIKEINERVKNSD